MYVCVDEVVWIWFPVGFGGYIVDLKLRILVKYDLMYDENLFISDWIYMTKNVRIT